MARSLEPSNGSDHPPQNGARARHVAIALFIATSFGIMAILSFPISGVIRNPFRLPRPLQAALSPAERALRPFIPWLGPLPRVGQPRSTVSLARGPGGVSAAPLARRISPGGPGTGPPPSPPPPGETPPPRVTRPSKTPTRPVLTWPPVGVRQLLGVLTRGDVQVSPRRLRALTARIARVESICRRAGPQCARQLAGLERVLERLKARSAGHRGGDRHEADGRGSRHDKEERDRRHAKHHKHRRDHLARGTHHRNGHRRHKHRSHADEDHGHKNHRRHGKG